MDDQCHSRSFQASVGDQCLGHARERDQREQRVIARASVVLETCVDLVELPCLGHVRERDQREQRVVIGLIAGAGELARIVARCVRLG